MKVYIQSLIDTDDLNLSRKEKKELILDIDLSVAEVEFTLEVLDSLLNSLSGDLSREEIIKHLLKNESKT